MTATAVPPRTVSDRGQAGRDIALMQLVAAGDVDAFAELYDVMAPQVYGLIRRVLTDSTQSEQLTQHVMLTVWRTAARYDPAAGSVSTCMLTTPTAALWCRPARTNSAGCGTALLRSNSLPTKETITLASNW